ncbi:SigB/SigF/SigG family RNA polymerase sigma factor [Nocardiopsis ansamitocini]|uniref:RNA polymerase sigma-B factor n=1 Tax=Nocardiopsis ansamitocini TaxID=1670832 RepID=A0A9W6P4X5_9ACTN|nr:SigB/SigF/SigG family RNA polymerase sigma factor [Nocardiopsis ansamitocini]GLU47280.1 hypothetical protein Nans01_16310 [Nocardiopsis ansamitocini]
MHARKTSDAASVSSAAPAQSRPQRDVQVAELFTQLAESAEGSLERDELRAAIAREHIGLARHLASRYANRGEPVEDLQQAALLGLVKAINGFDADLGYDFIAYAMPMMAGEIKRHFRDKTWAVRVPRRLQERRGELNQATRRLTQVLGRSPTTTELAEELQMTRDDLAELIEASTAYSALSLDSPTGDDGHERINLGDTIGGPDHLLELVDYRESLPPLLEGLPDRERRIVILRFFGNKTQSEIAADVGISQMHVSRLLSNALATMREGMLVEE